MQFLQQQKRCWPYLVRNRFNRRPWPVMQTLTGVTPGACRNQHIGDSSIPDPAGDQGLEWLHKGDTRKVSTADVAQTLQQDASRHSAHPVRACFCKYSSCKRRH